MSETGFLSSSAGSHTVLLGHRGLPSAEMFRNIDKLEIGDFFEIHTRGETILYEINAVYVCDPDDYSLLEPIEGLNLVTLYTCTPYAINTQRLLVRGTIAAAVGV